MAEQMVEKISGEGGPEGKPNRSADMARTRHPLTDKLVKELPAPAQGNRIVYDGTVAGLGLRITARGARSWIFNYRVRGSGTERRYTIGNATEQDGRTALTVKAARAKATELRQRVKDGADPMGDLHAEREAPTVNALADRFEKEHLPKKRPATVRDYKSLITSYIRPQIGKLRVSDLRHADVERLHAKIAATAPYRANRAVAVLSKMMALAVKWEMRADNPARGIERAPEQKRERFLTPAEIARLSAVLAGHPERASANAVRLLLLTGARKGEVLSATWDQFDLAAAVWLKPSAATKQKKEHRIPLSPPALQLLAEMKAGADRENERRRRDGKPELVHLFPGKEGQPLREIKRFWAVVSKKAGLRGVRTHDLRHTYASILASSGLSLPVIGALLGHSQAATTHRYAHLLDDPLRAATERAGAVITGAGKPAAEIVPMAGGRRA